MRATLRRLPAAFATILAVSLLILGLVGASVPAGAAGPGTVISPGLNTTGGTVTAADGSTRTLTSTDAAAMMQPMLAAMYYGTPQFLDAPPEGARSTIVFDWVFTAQAAPTTGTVTVNYAQRGDTGWMSFPAQALWPGSAVTSDTADRWFVASPAFVQAFNGKGTVQTFAPSDGPDDGGGSNDSSTSSSSSINGALVVGVIVLAVVVLAGALVLRRRRTDTTIR